MPRANSMCFPAGIHHSLIRPGSRQRIGALQERTEGVPSAPQNKRTGTAEYAAGKSWRVSSHVSLRRDYGTAVRVSGVAHTEPTMDFRLSQNQRGNGPKTRNMQVRSTGSRSLAPNTPESWHRASGQPHSPRYRRKYAAETRLRRRTPRGGG